MDDTENGAPRSVGAMIRQSRTARGLKQTGLAAAVGAGRQTTIASWETGKNLVPMVWLIRLAKVLEWTPEEMERALGMLAREARARVDGANQPDVAA